MLPPQADGAPVLLFVREPLQLPLAMALLDNQVANAELISAWVWQELTTVVASRMLKLGVVGASTVKVAWQVVENGAQVLIKLKVTVLEPPVHLPGAPIAAPLLEITRPQPPLAEPDASQAS